MNFTKTLNIEAPSMVVATAKVEALESLSKTDSDTLLKIADLMKKPGAAEKFNNAFNNPMVKMLF
jgi:hypothetical protein